MHIKLLLDYLVHQHIVTLIFLDHCGPFAEITEYPVEGVYVGLGCRYLHISEDQDVVAPLEVLDEVVDALPGDGVDEGQHLGLLGLVVPHLVGHLQLQKYVLNQKVDLGVVVTVVETVIREELDDILQNVEKTDQLHQVHILLSELFLTLAQFLSIDPLVVEIDAVLLAISLVLQTPDGLIYFFD